MAGRTSGEMREAQRHLWLGASGYKASKLTGIRESSISRSGLCQQIIATVSKAKDLIRTKPAATDAELLDQFMHELCIPEDHARHHIARRAEICNERRPRGRKRITTTTENP